MFANSFSILLIGPRFGSVNNPLISSSVAFSSMSRSKIVVRSVYILNIKIFNINTFLFTVTVDLSPDKTHNSHFDNISVIRSISAVIEFNLFTIFETGKFESESIALLNSASLCRVEGCKRLLIYIKNILYMA